ncbi:hypothetical protein [Spirillospora sp. NPDC047279]|uniref:hypothetical protein n=1 Tax=Spirillospora sp. NPDC047279 TaxID=3155478 RepID=UPI0034074437
MKGIVRGRRGRAAFGATALGLSLLASATPANAVTAVGKVEFTYSAPEVAEAGDTVTWRWSVKNVGGESVNKVLLTHKLTPMLKVRSVDAPCAVTATAIRCEYGTMKAGEERKGVVVAELPSDASGTVQINGRMTWQQGPAAPGGTATSPGSSTAPAVKAPTTAEAPAA